jgi:hypothetical protein
MVQHEYRPFDLGPNFDKMADKHEDFSAWTVHKLRKYLRDRGQHVSGRKKELVDRVSGCAKMGIAPLLGAEKSQDSPLIASIIAGLSTPDGTLLPDPNSLTFGWETITDSNFPDVAEHDIYNYMVLSTHR